MRIQRYTIVSAAVLALLLTMITALLAPHRLSTAAAALPSSPTSRLTGPSAEESRVDAVRTPLLHWKPCRRSYQCTSVLLPLDYDRPLGPRVRIALLKAPATDPSHRIGSLFVNPGGPGGSGRDVVVRGAAFITTAITSRFDLIGMDPRGTNGSTRVECYPDATTQALDTDVLAAGFPIDRAGEQRWQQASDRLARACSGAGRPLSAAMSTAEVARDMDVIRRAVGDRQLSFLGWSYGTYLGEMYADLFPDRVRALAIDGVVDARAWQGSATTARQPMTYRINPGRGTSRALRTLLRRCRAAGAPACPLMPDPEAAFARAAAGLRAAPLIITDEDGTTTLGYSDFVQETVMALYQPEALESVALLVQVVQQMIDDRDHPTTAAARTASGRGARSNPLATRLSALRSRVRADATDAALSNDWELNAAVSCSDSSNPHHRQAWSSLADRADRRTPYFGRYWLWLSSTCARWSAKDEDSHRVRFGLRTAHPVLVVGNTYDPATPYEAAVAVSRAMPGSGLLISDSWGHTAYGNSRCATAVIDRYLINGTLPAAGTVCVGDVEPYPR